MAVVETLVVSLGAYPQPTLSVTLDDGGGTLAASTVKYTGHDGVVVSVPLTLANCRNLFAAIAVDRSPATKAKYGL